MCNLKCAIMKNEFAQPHFNPTRILKTYRNITRIKNQISYPSSGINLVNYIRYLSVSISKINL